jgi:hypothetical protein
VLSLADVAAARATGAVQWAFWIQRIVERRHRHAPIVAAASKAQSSIDDSATGVPIHRGKPPGGTPLGIRQNVFIFRPLMKQMMKLASHCHKSRRIRFTRCRRLHRPLLKSWTRGEGRITPLGRRRIRDAVLSTLRGRGAGTQILDSLRRISKVT